MLPTVSEAKFMYESFMRLNGKRVYGYDSGKCFGRLSDILVNKGTNDIIGIVSKNDALLYRHRFFPKGDIVKINEVNLYVKGFGEKFVKVVPCESDFHSVVNDMYKRRAVLSDGSEAGKIQNVNMDLELGVITGFEVGSSLAHDLLNGRKICRIRDKVEICRGNVVLTDSLYSERKRKLLL